jgi:RNA polymerase sigma factor (sigma-70 family)
MSPTTMAADPGRTQTLEELFCDHRQWLWGLAYRLTGCAADAEDIVQETFARAVARATPCQEQAWRPWLMRVATNLSLDLLRRRRRRPYAGSWLPSAVETTEQNPLFETVTPSTDARY